MTWLPVVLLVISGVYVFAIATGLAWGAVVRVTEWWRWRCYAAELAAELAEMLAGRA